MFFQFVMALSYLLSRKLHVSEFVQSRHSDFVLLTLLHSKMPKTPKSFGHSECSGVKGSSKESPWYCKMRKFYNYLLSEVLLNVH